MYQVGDEVWDDLMRKNARILGVEVKQGICNKVSYHGTVIGYWLDNEWLGGARHPWEISDAIH